ncbi:isochorismatase family protein [Methylobacillus flagellatus]|uniref:Isochorismatase hydrolase n=1 Tax=Methylobacillus flagellatus (strain ATCC 51484 / DSM 6875 / VKM B-1610 / KT) TaxID=265072 RepID=Q1GY87_METFK|nr:isochorismatase family protein [Methylobacillus flagellatus]ABE50800.1 isochorismatase hydrolase [Methylobacillus flagellatus KT]
MTATDLAARALSQLVIIDVQEKLAAAMDQDAMAALTRDCNILLQASRLLEVPAIVTEQYPKGLGNTIPSLQDSLEHACRIEKTAFSCHAVPAFRAQLHADRPQLVLAGMEAHICVLQTALQLQQHGCQVIVVEDAVLSRNPANKANALLRLRQAGVIISNTESVVFEWLGVAEGEAFKAISRMVK